jgi:hypothetical protein
MEILLGWLLLSVVAGVAANARGRSGVGWFFLALVLSPFIVLIFVLVMRRLEPELVTVAPAAPPPQPRSSLRSSAAPAQKKCPDCAEMVQAEAKLCRFCRHEFKEPEKPNTPAIMGFGLAKSAPPVFPGMKVCPACYESNAPEWKICKRCGGKLPESPAASEELTRPCIACGETIRATARVCRRCGANQDAPAA